jgi:hypothetical protein
MWSHWSAALPDPEAANNTAIYEETSPQFGSPSRHDDLEPTYGGEISEAEAQLVVLPSFDIGDILLTAAKIDTRDNDSAIGDVSRP